MASEESTLDSEAPDSHAGAGRLGDSEFAMRATLDALAASQGTAVLGSTVDGTITSWGKGAEALYGWRAEEMTGRSIFIIAPDRDHDRLGAIIRTLAAGNPVHAVETECLRKDGTFVHVRIDNTPVRDEHGDVVGVASIHSDIGARRRAELALGEAEERYRSLIETLPALIYQVTIEDPSRTIYMSPRAAQLYGIPTEEVEPARIHELLHPDDRERVLAEIARANNAHSGLSLEYRIVRPDGTVVWIEDTSVVIEESGDEPARAQGYILDVSERKRLEEQLLQSQKMEAVGQLAGGIAHDFNNILTAIEGYTEFALEQAKENDDLRDDLLEIRKAAHRAATLTGQILAFGRRQVFHSRVLDLNEVIDDTKKLVLRLIGEHIEVVSRLEVGLGGVMADPSQLTQILVNLAVNARDAMVDGGSLAVSTKNVRLSDAFAEGLGLDGGPYVVLSVADTGAGMDEQTMKRAFEPFFTTKPVGSGSGLGLSTVYGIAHQSGGAVAIESTLGRGTTVRVYLPRVDEPAQADVATGAPLAPAPGRGTVLLVEDEPVIRKLVASMLERQGYAVFTAGEPNEALALASELTEIDLLVTDVVMPGMNGPELAAQLVAGRPGLPVLFISGYPADAIAGRRLVPDSAAVLRKPFGANELFSAIATVVSA